MKANVPGKIYVALNEIDEDGRTFVLNHRVDYPICTEYIRTDSFVEKARKWFEQNEYFDFNGIRRYGKDDFEDFKRYIEK